jgi:hypothetical protein
MIRFGQVVLIPAGDQAPAGRLVPAEGGRLDLAGGDAMEDRYWVAANDAELIETEACGMYLRVGRPTRIEGADQTEVAVDPGLYQVIRKQT